VLFNSYQFTFAFLPIFLIVFGTLSSRGYGRAMAAWLILSSLFFYAWWNWHYLFLFGFSIGFNYLWSRLIVPIAPEAASPAAERRRRILFGIGIATNVALLGYFKYRNFLAGSFASLVGAKWDLPALVLPLAISFFTFEQITFLSSAFNGEPGSSDFVSYLLFITFFPHLIAGPIVRYKQIYPQFNRGTKFALTAENLQAGLMIFAVGLFKKVMLADTFRDMADPLFGEARLFAFWDGWGAALAFVLQVYFDFSGYSDMAIGLAKMIGVTFPENFDSPYQSRSMIDVWRRWHITLSYFLRDYLYIPMGGNRHGKFRRLLNLVITMTIGGLWHGASWNFIIWGFANGLLIAVNHIWADTKRVIPDKLAWAMTFVCICITWVFFRAPTFSQAMRILKAMAGLDGFAYASVPRSMDLRDFRLIAIGLFIVLFCPNRQTLMAREWRNGWLYAGAFALMAGVSFLSMSNPPAFVYFQF